MSIRGAIDNAIGLSFNLYLGFIKNIEIIIVDKFSEDRMVEKVIEECIELRQMVKWRTKLWKINQKIDQKQF